MKQSVPEVHSGNFFPLQAKEVEFKAEKLFSLFPPDSWHERARTLLENVKKRQIAPAVSCSGGADSVFAVLLSWIFFERKIHLIHVNHRTRGIDSEKDACFVDSLSQKLGCQVSLLNFPQVPPFNEGALRTNRICLIKEAMKTLKVSHLIQGHQKNDVAESFLWRLSRGASPFGLCSPMPVKNHEDFIFVRPFITLSKLKIVNALQELGITWREDESNQSQRFLRNRIRARVIPAWEDASDRDYLTGVGLSRDLIEEQNEALDQWISSSYTQSICAEGLDANKLKMHPMAVKRGIISKWLSDKNLSFTHQNLTEIISSLDSNLKNSFNIGKDYIVKFEEQKLFISSENSNPAGFSPCSLVEKASIHLPYGGEVSMETASISSQLMHSLKRKKINVNSNAWICADSLNDMVVIVRSQIEKDHFQHLGSPGSKSVKKMMIDRKIPKLKRKMLPIFLNKNDEILWIPGIPPAEKFKITPDTRKVIRLTYSAPAT